MTLLDLSPDELLSTTRAVRKRLDFERPVERELLDECLALAQQAPNGVERGAVALRRRDRGGDEGEARRVLRDRLGGATARRSTSRRRDGDDAPVLTRRSTSPTASTRCP